LRLIVLLAPLCAPSAAFAGPDNGLHGRFEAQGAVQFNGPQSLEAALGDQTAGEGLTNLRLTWEPTFGNWSLQAHYLVSAELGPAVALSLQESALLPAPPPTMFNLTNVFADHGQLIASQTIDRLAITYSTPQWVFRLGRQAITWGSGLVFRPMDLFDPFSPSATDTEYKPGVDMLYVQRLFANGSDLQLIVAPRPQHFGGPPTLDDSSAALHFQTTLADHPITLLLAHDHGDWVGGVGVNGGFRGATWNVELIPTFEPHGATRFSAVANISDAVTLAGHNATVFGEYFRNGFGVVGEPFNLADLPADLKDRLVRGQVFDTRRDYLAAGLTFEATPLLTATGTAIIGLDDGSAFLLASATYSISDDVSLTGGAQVPIGPRGTEFGGLPLTSAGGPLVAPPAQLYVQLRCYF
jgi:hypothetical protein